MLTSDLLVRFSRQDYEPAALSAASSAISERAFAPIADRADSVPLNDPVPAPVTARYDDEFDDEFDDDDDDESGVNPLCLIVVFTCFL